MELTPLIEQHLTANGHMRKRDIIASNFLGGLFWGLGSVIGATIVVALLIAILRTINFVPLLNTITNSILDNIQQKESQQINLSPGQIQQLQKLQQTR